MQYRCLTLNVKGINHCIKRKHVITINYLRQHHVALLQETHLTDTEHAKLKQGGYNQVFFSSYTLRARGVAILINKKIPFPIDFHLRRQRKGDGLLYKAPFSLNPSL